MRTDEQSLRSALDRVGEMIDKAEHIRDLLISCDRLYEDLCKELAVVRAPFSDLELKGPEGPGQWLTAPPPDVQMNELRELHARLGRFLGPGNG